MIRIPPQVAAPVAAAPPDHDVPTYSGRVMRRYLLSCYGLPNTAPRISESHFGRCRALFVDDDDASAHHWIDTGKRGITARKGKG